VGRAKCRRRRRRGLQSRRSSKFDGKSNNLNKKIYFPRSTNLKLQNKNSTMKKKAVSYNYIVDYLSQRDVTRKNTNKFNKYDF
jgi:hypothetical protein